MVSIVISGLLASRDIEGRLQRSSGIGLASCPQFRDRFYAVRETLQDSRSLVVESIRQLLIEVVTALR